MCIHAEYYRAYHSPSTSFVGKVRSAPAELRADLLLQVSLCAHHVILPGDRLFAGTNQRTELLVNE